VRQLFRYALGLSPQEATFSRRGFYATNLGVRERLEDIGRTFISGYNQALDTNDLATLARRLANTENELCGFAYEGAATALALLDHLTPWNCGRLRRFIDGPAAGHVYMAHVGAGWAIARIPWLRQRLDAFLAQLDPLLCWLAIDGYGFQEGFFKSRKNITAKKYPAGLSGYARRVFDQGLGRSLWFVNGTDVSRISETITSFPEIRRADLWSGVGLACAYAGRVDHTALERLRAAAGGWTPDLAQGAAFAAKTRQRAGNQADHTETACWLLCGLSAEAAAKITDDALEHLKSDGEEPAYEIWRRRIRAKFGSKNGL
jgi:hypothetical protein